MKWFLKCFKQYADFSGRARRKEYWMFALFYWLALFVILFIVGAIINIGEPAERHPGDLGGGAASVGFLMIVFILATFTPSLAVLVRRLHDTGRSGWWVFITFIPYVGGIWLFVLTVLEGNKGDNEYGPDPKASDDEWNPGGNYGTPQKQYGGNQNGWEPYNPHTPQTTPTPPEEGNLVPTPSVVKQQTTYFVLSSPPEEGNLVPTPSEGNHVRPNVPAGGDAQQVTFLRETRDGSSVWIVYKAPCKADAMAFLSRQYVDKSQYYVVVETPEGNFGKDKEGIYQE
jgi:uncharacterized membrane protein YhaH (DUF805 family)